MGKNVLIVDDEKAIVDILDFNLRKEGYETLCAYDGPEGLRMAREENPDLMLLDVMLQAWTALRSAGPCAARAATFRSS